MKQAWRRSFLGLIIAWGRHQIWRIVGVILLLWIFAAAILHLVEPAENSAFATWGESLWNVWGSLFGAGNGTPETIAGRVIVGVVIIAGVALAALFTASIASILIDRALRRRQVTNIEMSDHLVLCHWAPRGLEWIREVHSNIVAEKRPIVIVHDNPDEIELPEKSDDPAFNDVYIVKGDPANEIILRRAKAHQAHSVVILSDDRQGEHADGKTIVCCIAVKNVMRSNSQTNIVVECRDPKYRHHMRKAGADEVMSAAEFGLRLLARASLYHGMTRVYQELLTVGRDANEMYMIAAPEGLLGKDFVEIAQLFLEDRETRKACLLIGIYRGEKMMLNPLSGEAGKLREGDELILLSQVLPDLSYLSNAAKAAS
ncbi:MAG: NAD-binding protein [Hyphomicrobium sp.]|jgi:voltage-gated potassium channel